MAKFDIFLEDINASDKVNSGNPIYLQAISINYNVGVFTQVPETPGKAISQTHQNILAYGDSLGFENPTITVSGIINLEDYDETVTFTGDGDANGNSPANIISFYLIQQIFTSGHTFKLTDVYYANNSTLSSATVKIYRTHSMTGTFPSETITEARVMCTGARMDSNPRDSQNGGKIGYTLTLKEVRY